MNFDAVTSFISRLRNYAAIVKMLLEVDLPKLEAAAVQITTLLGEITGSHNALAAIVATPAPAVDQTTTPVVDPTLVPAA